MWWLLFGALAIAADPPAEPPAPEPATEAKPAAAEAKPAPAEPKPPPTVEAKPGRGITVTSADGNYAFRIGARLQLRQTFDLGAPVDDERHFTSLTQIRTARVAIGGHVLSPKVKYTMVFAFGEGDYRDTARSPVLDAFVDLQPSRDASVRLGQLFVPFDRSRTTRDVALQLPNRPLPVGEFNLDRGIGAYAYSEKFLGESSPIGWKAGVFASNGLHLVVNQPPGAIFVGRVEFRPLGPINDDVDGDQERREKPGVAFGGAAAYSLDTSRVRSVQGTFLPGDNTADYFHFTGDVVFKFRGFALLAEVIGRNANVDYVVDDSEPPVVRYTRSGWGWFAQPSYAITKQFELVARYAEMKPFYNTDPDLDYTHEVAGGANLYLNGHFFKVQADWQMFWENDDLQRANHAWHAVLDVSF